MCMGCVIAAVACVGGAATASKLVLNKIRAVKSQRKLKIHRNKESGRV